jgi:hypothetical protein
MESLALRKFAALLIAIVLVVALWIGGWLWAAGELRTQVALLAQNDGETNPKITCGTLNVTGFPFRFDIECADGTLTQLDTTVTVAGVRASAMVYNPTHVLISAKAPLTIADAFSGAQSRVDFTGLQASARLASRDLIEGFSGAGWRIANVSLVADGVTWNDTVVGDLLRMSADHVEAHLVDLPEGRDKAAHTATLGIYASLANFSFPELQVSAAQSTLEAKLDQLPDDLTEFTSPDALRNWQARGGKLTLAKFAGNQPAPVESFEVAGELSLGPTGLANGQVTYTTRGILDRLLARAIPPVPPLQVVMFKGMPNPDGTSTNTLAIADGKVTLAGFLIAELLPAF